MWAVLSCPVSFRRSHDRQRRRRGFVKLTQRVRNRSYETLSGLFSLSPDRLRSISMPLGIILGGFLLPVLYGALGTCAFVLRSLYREMVDRTFDGRRTGEFLVRIFLGMVSGLTLQWLVVRADGTIAGGVTPAVLALSVATASRCCSPPWIVWSSS
jgi:hypothetical protein